MEENERGLVIGIIVFGGCCILIAAVIFFFYLLRSRGNKCPWTCSCLKKHNVLDEETGSFSDPAPSGTTHSSPSIRTPQRPNSTRSNRGHVNPSFQSDVSIISVNGYTNNPVAPVNPLMPTLRFKNSVQSQRVSQRKRESQIQAYQENVMRVGDHADITNGSTRIKIKSKTSLRINPKTKATYASVTATQNTRLPVSIIQPHGNTNSAFQNDFPVFPVIPGNRNHVGNIRAAPVIEVKPIFSFKSPVPITSQAPQCPQENVIQLGDHKFHFPQANVKSGSVRHKPKTIVQNSAESRRESYAPVAAKEKISLPVSLIKPHGLGNISNTNNRKSTGKDPKSTLSTHTHLILAVDATPRQIGGYIVNPHKNLIQYYSLNSNDMPWNLRNRTRIGNPVEFEMKNLFCSLLLWDDLIISKKKIEIYTDNSAIIGNSEYGQRVRNILHHFKKCMGVEIMNESKMYVHRSRYAKEFNKHVKPADSLSRDRVSEFEVMLRRQYPEMEFQSIKFKKVREVVVHWSKNWCDGCGFYIPSTGSLKKRTNNNY